MFRAVKSIVRANFINQPMMIGRSKVERVPKPRSFLALYISFALSL